jgi:hypothetical protein
MLPASSLTLTNFYCSFSRDFYRYIESSVGINQTDEDWTLVTKQSLAPEQVVIRIPKKLCIFCSPDARLLLPAAMELINRIQPSQWRARIAIALLSERVRPDSFYYPYLANLPFEFWGVPLFFNSTEFNMIQDPTLMQKMMERCKFLYEFSNEALIPLHRTPLDPFSAQKPR